MNNQNTPFLISIGARQEAQPNEILFFEAAVNYTTIHFANGKKLMVATTIKALEERFKPYNFYRVHKGCMVNMAYVKHYCAFENTIQMADNKHIISIARRRATDLKLLIMNSAEQQTNFLL